MLSPLKTLDEAQKLATKAREAAKPGDQLDGKQALVTPEEMEQAFMEAQEKTQRRGDEGVRQREFLNTLHRVAERKIQALA